MPSHSIEFLVAQAFYRFPSHSIECLIPHIARNIYILVFDLCCEGWQFIVLHCAVLPHLLLIPYRELMIVHRTPMLIIYKEQWKTSQFKYEKEYTKLFTTSSKHNTSTSNYTFPIYIYKTLELRAFTYLFSHWPMTLHTAKIISQDGLETCRDK